MRFVKDARVIAAFAAVVAVALIVAAVLVLKGHGTVKAIQMRDGHPQVVKLESPCTRWEDLFGDCELPASMW